MRVVGVIAGDQRIRATHHVGELEDCHLIRRVAEIEDLVLRFHRVPEHQDHSVDSVVDRKDRATCSASVNDLKGPSVQQCSHEACEHARYASSVAAVDVIHARTKQV